MKATGIIVEYNPFHNGHLLHLQEARKRTKADVIIAVMSGSFLQRGEPALLPKWERAQMAIDAGVDLIVELPFSFATQQAAIFANGAVEILDALGVQSLFFGSENGDAQTFSKVAKLITEQSAQFKAIIRRFLDNKTNSYASAWHAAINELAPDLTLDLAQPNNILGFHYTLAVIEQKKRIEIATMPRQSAAYHEQKPTHQSIASATSIRSMLLANDWKSVRQYVPGTTLTILQEYRETHSFITWQDFWPLLKYQLVITPTKQLQNIRGISEGIENRLQQAGIRATNFDEFLKHATTKRYSDSRIKRTSLQVLAKQTSPKENYIRLLGMSAIGQQYLRQVKKDITLPLISTASKASPTLLNNDIRATKLYSLAPTLENQFLRDFHTPPYRKKP
ncbi:nucleotidyltransferase [Paenilisteria rocourtiae]|uniref:tRNA(Met) cytidine acetate ligase n=1 Tax=Listeria rocourtiae TaxID=647910 RepID=A0A4R6ZSH7_9LIST|nr:nucleotidyltransferase [Listeria rocourtiae]TDR55402.1 putative nucleotidyltransferase [Listeria rocourtiae]